MQINPDTFKPYKIAATWLGCGDLKPAPGTWGTLGALPFGAALMFAQANSLLLIAIAAITALGFWSASIWEKETGIHDDKRIVIDEVAGMWIALIPAALNPFHILVAFALFRFFDILKPFPIGWIDQKLPGAASVMLDDIYAGLAAGFILLGLRYALHF